MQKLAQHQRQFWQIANVSNLSKWCQRYIYSNMNPLTIFIVFFFSLLYTSIRCSDLSWKVQLWKMLSTMWAVQEWKSLAMWFFTSVCPPNHGARNPLHHSMTTTTELSPAAHHTLLRASILTLWRERERRDYISTKSKEIVHPKLLLAMRYSWIHGLMGLLLLTNEKL